MEKLFRPTNKQKYVGDVNNIIYRSNLELNFFHYFDKKKAILEWGSEELNIKYLYSVDQQYHQYYPDIILKYKNKKNEIKKAIVEIKCLKELIDTIYHLLNKKSFNKKNSINLLKKILKIDENEISQLLKKYQKPKRITKKYMEYLNGVMKNIDKWIYCLEFCEKNNLEFYVFTEIDIKRN